MNIRRPRGQKDRREYDISEVVALYNCSAGPRRSLRTRHATTHATLHTLLSGRNFAPATRQADPFHRCPIVELIRHQENRASEISEASDDFRQPLVPNWGCTSTTAQGQPTPHPELSLPRPLPLRSRQPRSNHPIPMVQGQLGGSGIDLYRWTG